MGTSNSQKSEIQRLIAATGYSAAGLRSAWAHEAAFRSEILASLILIPAALWLGETALERILLIGSVFAVLIIELVNSAIEAAVDRIGDEHHPLAGRAKDQASAAVFLSMVLAGITWGLIIWTKIN